MERGRRRASGVQTDANCRGPAKAHDEHLLALAPPRILLIGAARLLRTEVRGECDLVASVGSANAMLVRSRALCGIAVVERSRDEESAAAISIRESGSRRLPIVLYRAESDATAAWGAEVGVHVVTGQAGFSCFVADCHARYATLHGSVVAFARRHGLTPAQVELLWRAALGVHQANLFMALGIRADEVWKRVAEIRQRSRITVYDDIVAAAAGGWR